MRDKVKRFISILMTALMLVNLMPVGALADGITSIGYKPETVANYDKTVYVYVKVTGNLNGLKLNNSGWCTVGKVTGLEMPNPKSYDGYGHMAYVNGYSASSVGRGVHGFNPFDKNQSINRSNVTWTGGKYGFVAVEYGADDYVGSGWTWHLDGYIDISQVQSSYKIRYVDYDNKDKILNKNAASGTGDPGTWIDYTAPEKLEGGYEIVGDTDRTFKLEQIDNTFDIYYRRQYGYKVEYYYDDVKDEHETVIGESQLCGTEINAYTPKLKDGYELDRVENCPLTIGTDESKNVIKVYYKKIGYTVTYEPGEHGDFKAKVYNAKHGDATPAFDGETTGKPGWTFAGWEPKVAEKVTEDAMYVAQWKEKDVAVNYEAEYGGTTESLSTQTITAFSAEKLKAVNAPDKSKEGYAFIGWFKGDDPNPLEMKVELSKETAEANLNKDKNDLFAATTFIAKYAPLTATVKYIVEKDGVQVETPISTQTISVIDGEPLADVTANPIEGYRFEGWYLHDVRIDEAEGSTLEAATAKVKLHKIDPLYTDTTFVAKFVPDETKKATVLYTISLGQSDYGSIAPSAQQIILQATGKLDSDGGSVSGSTATAKTGYKFAGWYKATGEATYEKVTDDPELTSELAESKLNRDKETGLYQNTVFEARFEPDAGAKVPVTYKAENGTLEGTTSQEAQIVTGDGLTDVTAATPNKGYKFDGWYVVDKNDNETRISGLDPAEKLNAKKAKENLNKDGNLYAETTFIARFVPDTKQSAKVIYTTDGNGTLWGGPAIKQITQFVQIVTGEVVREDGSVIGDKLTTIPTYPKDGYEFDRWIRVSPETTIEGADSALTDEKARPNLNQKNGLYEKTEFRAIFKPRTNLSYTVSYYWNGTTEKVTESKTIGGKMFGEEFTESPIGVEGYTPVSTESQTITLGTGTNEINFYYYKNVELTANSRTLTYDGYEHGVSGFTGAPEEADFSTIKVGANGTDANTYPANFAEDTVGTFDKTEKYIVTKTTDGQLVIEKRKVTLTSEGGSKVYDGSPLTKPEVQIEGSFVDGEVLGIVAQGTVTHVSEGEVTNTIFFNRSPDFKDSNYNIVQNEGKLWITPRQVTLTSETASKPYDGTELTKPDVQIEGSFVEGEVTDIKALGKVKHVSEGEVTNTITYTKGANFKESNYTITKNEGKLSITPLDGVVVTIEGRTKTVTYNGEEHTAWQYDVVRISDPLYEPAPGEAPNFWNKNAKGASGTDAGTYPMGWKAEDFENTNTNFSNVTFVVTDGKLVINPRPVTLTSADLTKVYDGTPLKNGDAPVTEMSGTEKAFPDGEGLEYDFTGSQTDVGKSENTFTYKAKEGTNPDNYAITTEFGTLEVTPVTDRVTVKIKGKTDSVMYDGKLHFVFGFDAESSNKLYNPNKDMWFNGTDVDMIAEGTDAGTYNMELEPGDFKNKSDNFTNVRFEVVEDGKLEIKKRSVKLTSASDEKVYDGKPLTNETVAVGGDGFADGEGATYDFTGSQTDVGESENKFTFEVNENTNKDNYTFEVAIGKLKVNPVTDKVTVTVTEKSDTVTYDGMPHTVSGYASMTADNPLYDVEDSVDDTPTAAWAANGTDAGEYPLGIEAGDFKNTNKNFTNVEFVVVDGALKIDPAPVTLQAPIASKTYDGTPLKAEDYGHSFVEGLDFADDFASISVEGSQTQAGSSVSQIKEVVPKKGKDLKNYKLTFLPGTLTIAKRSVLITSQSATKTYDGSALTRPAVTITGDGFVPGELAKAEATGSITNVGSTPNAIQYTTTGAFNAANYSIALSVGTLTVTEKPKPEPRRTFNLTISYVYQNGKRAAASYNRGGLKNGETFDITSPVIAGYTASETVVSGTIYNRDIKVTVIYTADGVNLDDYGVPLGLGNITMNVGDCFE